MYLIWENFLMVNFMSLMFLGHSKRKVVNGHFRCVECGCELGVKQEYSLNQRFLGLLEDTGDFFFIGFLPVFSGGSLVFFYSPKFWPVMGLESSRVTHTVIMYRKMNYVL